MVDLSAEKEHLHCCAPTKILQAWVVLVFLQSDMTTFLVLGVYT